MSEQGDPAAGKGRPTPKRREAQRQRRRPVAAPKTRREAYRRSRAESRQGRGRVREALRTGDERFLPPRDAGPVRRYVRDVVDARRNAGNYLVFLAIVVLMLGTFAPPIIKIAIVYSYPLFILYIVFDAYLLVRRVRAKLAVAFPQEDPKGHGSYAVLRSFQMRRLRLPPPRVKVGDPV